MYYTRIEKDIFEDIVEHGGKPVYMGIRGRDNGRTEWVYASEKVIDEAFMRAHKKYGGNKPVLRLALKSRNKQEADKLFKGEIYFRN